MTIAFLRPLFLVLLLALPLLWFFPRRLDRAVLGVLRSLLFALIIVALAGPVLVTPAGSLFQVFVLDQSASIAAPQRQRALQLLDHRRRLRAEKSRPVIDKIAVWRDAQRVLPGTKFAKGLTYLKNQWQPLTLFLDDPEIPLDNNEAEREIRGPVRGRKAHLGSHSERGARVAALLYSLLGTCRKLGVDPRAWMVAALTRARAQRGTVTLPSDFAAETSPAT